MVLVQAGITVKLQNVLVLLPQIHLLNFGCIETNDRLEMKCTEAANMHFHTSQKVSVLHSELCLPVHVNLLLLHFSVQ